MAESRFPREVQMKQSRYENYFMGGVRRKTTILVYECIYKDPETGTTECLSCCVTQSRTLHAEEVMLGNLRPYMGRIESLTMWINNSPCGNHPEWHKCAQQLAGFIDSNPGVTLTLYCVYHYGKRSIEKKAASRRGLKLLIRKGAKISSIPPKGRADILITAMSFNPYIQHEKWWDLMKSDAYGFDKLIYTLQMEIEEQVQTEAVEERAQAELVTEAEAEAERERLIEELLKEMEEEEEEDRVRAAVEEERERLMEKEKEERAKAEEERLMEIEKEERAQAEEERLIEEYLEELYEEWEEEQVPAEAKAEEERLIEEYLEELYEEWDEEQARSEAKAEEERLIEEYLEELYEEWEEEQAWAEAKAEEERLIEELYEWEEEQAWAEAQAEKEWEEEQEEERAQAGAEV